jgi:Ca2+-transporting ATPase
MNQPITQQHSAWSKSVNAVLGELGVDSAIGLKEYEARRRRALFGPNQLQVASQRHAIAILIDQFTNIVVVLLVGAGVLALLFSDFAEAVAIFAVILINATIGFVTEWRAVRSMEALRRFARVTCVLRRAGTVRHAAAEDLVPGDIVLLEAGDLVPADIRLIHTSKLAANESTLTGESLPVQKHTDVLDKNTILMERHNMAFKGTTITLGSAQGVVVTTGMKTEFGKICEQVRTAEAQQSPLEKRLDELGKRLAWVVIVLGGLIAIIAVVAGLETFLAVEVAIALSVAAIPEGLPIVATIALARGMWHMAKRNALITRLSAVETLGATSVILTDKTGTLTENRMTATTVLLADADIAIAEPVDVDSAILLDELFTTAALCNNAVLPRNVGHREGGVGDPTEVALLDAAAHRGIWREDLLEQSPEVYEDAFDPDSKRMATVHERGGGVAVAVKGAPEAILSNCVAIRTSQGVVPLDAEAVQTWLGRVEKLGALGLRLIAIAEKTSYTMGTDLYDGLTLFGVVGLEDPARKGVKDAVATCHEAAITVVMVTGDHAETAKKVAARTGYSLRGCFRGSPRNKN